MYFVAEYVASQMKLETSFSHEAENARKCAQFLALTPELRDDIYVPKVYGKKEGYPESDRILVMEWVDGCRWVSGLFVLLTHQVNGQEATRSLGPQPARGHGPRHLSERRDDFLVGLHSLRPPSRKHLGSPASMEEGQAAAGEL